MGFLSALEHASNPSWDFAPTGGFGAMTGVEAPVQDFSAHQDLFLSFDNRPVDLFFIFVVGRQTPLSCGMSVENKARPVFPGLWFCFPYFCF